MLGLALALTYPCPLSLTEVLLFLLAAIFDKPPVVNPLSIQALSALTIKNAASPVSIIVQSNLPSSKLAPGGKIIFIKTGDISGATQSGGQLHGDRNAYRWMLEPFIVHDAKRRPVTCKHEIANHGSNHE